MIGNCRKVAKRGHAHGGNPEDPQIIIRCGRGAPTQTLMSSGEGKPLRLERIGGGRTLVLRTQQPVRRYRFRPVCARPWNARPGPGLVCQGPGQHLQSLIQSFVAQVHRFKLYTCPTPHHHHSCSCFQDASVQRDVCNAIKQCRSCSSGGNRAMLPVHLSRIPAFCTCTARKQAGNALCRHVSGRWRRFRLQATLGASVAANQHRAD